MAKSNRRKTIYVVVGKGRCGKSSVIRCLTGVARASTIPITLVNQTILDISVWVRSAQESGKSPNHVLQELNAMKSSIGLISLRQGTYNGQATANTYITVLRQQFKIIKYPITLPRISPNANAAIARGQWGWL
jgi:ABC-type cobalamin/Fe3+-siderophores transport system ATPase subunit